MNRKELAVIALITFMTVIAWIIFGISHARNTTSITELQRNEVVPLTPTFDNDIIKQLTTREE